MSDINVFEIASRLKIRFASAKGQLSVEDLWELPLTEAFKGGHLCNLNDLARGLHAQLKGKSEEISFVPDEAAPEETIEQKILSTQLEIVKHIIAVRVQERKNAKHAAEKSAAKQRIMAQIAKKKDEAQDALSLEELEAQLAAL